MVIEPESQKSLDTDNVPEDKSSPEPVVVACPVVVAVPVPMFNGPLLCSVLENSRLPL